MTRETLLALASEHRLVVDKHPNGVVVLA